MFQFPWFPPPALCVQTGVTGHDPCRVSPFGHPRIEARSAAPRGLSQPPTSFIGIWRQGIHRWLFIAWKKFKDARARYSVLKVRTGLLRARRSIAPNRNERLERRLRHGATKHGVAEVRPLFQNGTARPGFALPVLTGKHTE